jgi:AcrR family transcriptional regulator
MLSAFLKVSTHLFIFQLLYELTPGENNLPRPKTISDQSLLEAARMRFLADGIGASTRRIASDAAVSEGVLFQRFGTKEELFFLAMRLPAPDLGEAVRRAMRKRSRRQGLTVIAAAALDYLRDATPGLLLVISHPARQARLAQGARDAHDMLAEAFGLHAAFRRYLESLVEPEKSLGTHGQNAIGLLVSALLVQAIHEQIGISSLKDSTHWLRSTVGTIDRLWGEAEN